MSGIELTKKPTVSLLTWGSTDTLRGSFASALEDTFFTGLTGHAAIELTMPYSDENMQLVKKHLGDSDSKRIYWEVIPKTQEIIVYFSCYQETSTTLIPRSHDEMLYAGSSGKKVSDGDKDSDKVRQYRGIMGGD